MPLGAALHGLITLTVIVVAAVLAGRAFARLGQPSVLGPILLGVVVGVGVSALPAEVGAVLMTASSRSLLEAVGTAGLLLLMFSVGAELREIGGAGARGDRLRDAAAGWRLVPSVLVPILLCGLAAWPFARELSAAGHTRAAGWLFVGIALGVTAVPVLVTIIRDLSIASLPESRAALRIALLTDGLAWVLVTVLVVLSTNLAAVSVARLVAGALMLVALVGLAPAVIRRVEVLHRGGPLVATMVVCGLAGASATQFLGFHPAIGAAVAGFCFPAGLQDAASHRSFESIVQVLLPAFFVTSAMSLPIHQVHGAGWGEACCVLTLAAAAVVGKLGAGFVFGALQSWPWRSSARLGVLLNCRGVTEIAIASVGLQAGLIGPFAFATLCGLAIVTTASTAPLYRALSAGAVPLATGGVLAGQRS